MPDHVPIVDASSLNGGTDAVKGRDEPRSVTVRKIELSRQILNLYPVQDRILNFWRRGWGRQPSRSGSRLRWLRGAIADLDYRPTVFSISQRTASIMNADLILVLEDGRLAGKGAHAELMESCPVYREIYDSQFRKEAAS